MRVDNAFPGYRLEVAVQACLGASAVILRLPVDHEARQGACKTPRLNASRFEKLVVGQIRSNILTAGNIRYLVRLVDMREHPGEGAQAPGRSAGGRGDTL